MIFTRVRFENLFAYEGVQEVDLTGCGGRHNIVLIFGRNGTGKTSFINGIKLLFLGASNKELRSVGFPPLQITERQYVLGVPGLWTGVMNSRARSQGATTASISIDWLEHDGSQWTARRTWQVNGSKWTEKLQLFRDGDQEIDDKDFSLQLAEKLPSDFVPYFFFDGEQIRELAESEHSFQVAHIERLLGLSFVDEIQNGVSGFVRDRRREAMPSATKIQIARVERDLDVYTAQQEEATTLLDEVTEEIREAEERKLLLIRRQDGLRSGRSDADRRLLEQKLEYTQERKADLAADICEKIPSDAPFIANQELTNQAYEEVNRIVLSRAAEELTKISDLREELPEQLLRQAPHPTPPLTVPQIDYLSNKLQSLLDRHTQTAELEQIPPHLKSVDLASAQNLRDRYLAWIREGPRNHEAIVNALHQMRTLTAEEESTAEELARMSVVSDSHLREYQGVTEALRKVEEELRERSENKGKIEERIEQLRPQISEAQKQISSLEKEYDQAIRASEVVQFARRVEVALNEFKSRRRSLKRETLESGINEKVQILLAEHGQIAEVRLGENFLMTYYDSQGQQIGRASISAGMKQLIATALLWALKDECGKNVPLVIDTPLARIDRRNRVRLVNHYYPNAGEQVIVLPTDSELDDSQLMGLTPHIAKRYRIENFGGESAKFILEETSA